MGKTQNTPATTLADIQAKFKRLKEIKVQLEHVQKALYTEHDNLVEDLLPLFIDEHSDHFLIRREITLGTEKYRFNPSFYNEEKNKVMAKFWKSACHISGTIS